MAAYSKKRKKTNHIYALLLYVLSDYYICKKSQPNLTLFQKTPNPFNQCYKVLKESDKKSNIKSLLFANTLFYMDSIKHFTNQKLFWVFSMVAIRVLRSIFINCVILGNLIQ